MSFRISSYFETKLLNDFSLKRLSHLRNLDLQNPQTTLNVSFVPSSLQYLSIKNITNQQSIINSNITHLLMFNSETPLKYIPINLRNLWLSDSNFNLTCKHLQQSKIEQLLIHKSIRGEFNSFNLSCLPANLSALQLQDNKIQNINLQPLISHPHIQWIGLIVNSLNCTCKTFRDFIQLASKQSTNQLSIDCSPNSLLSDYELRYSNYSTTNQTTLNNILRHDRDNLKCLKILFSVV